MRDGGRVEIENTGLNGTVEQAPLLLRRRQGRNAHRPPAADLNEAVKTMELLAAIMAGLRE